MWHVVDFFELSNNLTMSWMLSIAFEIGAAASLASLIILEKMNKTIVWFLFILLTAFQSMGNTYYAYAHLQDFKDWIELFGLNTEPIIVQKRIISIVSGAILPIVALGFIKALVDYIKPTNNINMVSDVITLDSPKSISEENKQPTIIPTEEEQPTVIPEEQPLVIPTKKQKATEFDEIIDKAMESKQRKKEYKDTYDEKGKSYLDVRKT